MWPPGVLVGSWDVISSLCLMHPAEKEDLGWDFTGPALVYNDMFHMLKDLQGQGSFFFFNARDGGAGQAMVAGLHVADQSSSNEVGVLIKSRMKA